MSPLTSVTRGLAWLLGGILVIAAVAKLAGLAPIAQTFRRWGYPDGTAYVIAALELTAGLLLFVPISSRLGAMVGLAVMGGATATHLGAGEYGVAGLPVLVGIGLLWVAIAEPSPGVDLLPHTWRHP